MSPGGAAFSTLWLRSKVSSTRWCCFAMQSWASPEVSKYVPIVANTLSSSVSAVQMVMSPALPTGMYSL